MYLIVGTWAGGLFMISEKGKLVKYVVGTYRKGGKIENTFLNFCRKRKKEKKIGRYSGKTSYLIYTTT